MAFHRPRFLLCRCRVMGLSAMRSFSRISSSSSVGRLANARNGEVTGEGVVPSGVVTVGEAVELLIGVMLWLLIEAVVLALVVFREESTEQPYSREGRSDRSDCLYRRLKLYRELSEVTMR